MITVLRGGVRGEEAAELGEALVVEVLVCWDC
jgi:hypothetical protein